MLDENDTQEEIQVPQREFEANEIWLVASAIEHFSVKTSRSFFYYIGQALWKADRENALKIKNTWPEDWARYLQMGKEKFGND